MLGNILWLLACGVGGWLTSAHLIRMTMPQSVPEKISMLPGALKTQMTVAGLGGALLASLLGAGLMRLNASFAGLAQGQIVWTILQALLFTVSGAWLGFMLAFVTTINDYHEVRVAMYDFSGVLWVLGAIPGAVVGGVLWGFGYGDWWQHIVFGVAGGLGGIVVGYVVGYILTQALRQYMLKLHA